MFIPSARIWEKMQSEAAGCWPVPINGEDEVAFVAKMPASVIKAAFRSCPISLTIALADTPDGTVLATTLVINDDPDAPLMLSGVLSHKEEQLALESILRTGKTLIVFFDELSRPVARASCTLTSTECKQASVMVDASVSRYAGPWTQLLSDVLDEVQAFSDPKLAVPAKYTPEFVVVPLTLSEFETHQSTTIGLADVLDFQLDDSDEGGGLEQSTWHLLEELFEGHIVHSPQVLEERKQRELTDILTYCDAGMCLFETKVAGCLSTNLDRSTERRTKNLGKQIDKGINQLVGAIRNLERRRPLFTKDGSSLQLPAQNGTTHQGVIIVSEMLPSLDWVNVREKLLDASRESDMLLHVLDLRELRVLVGVSKDDPLLFAARLAHRFKIMAESKHAMLRWRLGGPPVP